MLRGILSRFLGGGRRTTGTAGMGAGGLGTGTTRTGTTGSSGDIERGARTLFRGLRSRRRGL